MKRSVRSKQMSKDPCGIDPDLYPTSMKNRIRIRLQEKPGSESDPRKSVGTERMIRIRNPGLELCTSLI